MSSSRNHAVVAFALVALAPLTTGCDGCARSSGGAAGSSSAAPSATLVPDAAPINATPLPPASVAAMVNPDKLPAYAGPTGSVEGTVTVTGDPAPETDADFSKCPGARDIFGHAFTEGTPKEPGGPRALADAIVAISGYTGGFYVPEKNEAVEVTIKGCGFTRRAITMTYGQRLDVKNESKDFWTPFLRPGPNHALTMAVPNGDPAKLYPKTDGLFLLGDFDRKYATAAVYVFRQSLHTTSDRTGHYRIDGVPVGKVTVSSTHVLIANSNDAKEIEIAPGVVHKVDLRLVHTKPAPPGPSDAGRSDAAYSPPLH